MDMDLKYPWLWHVDWTTAENLLALSYYIQAQEAENRSDTTTMMSQQKLSQGLSIAGIVSGTVVYVIWVIIVIIVRAVSFSRF